MPRLSHHLSVFRVDATRTTGLGASQMTSLLRGGTGRCHSQVSCPGQQEITFAKGKICRGHLG